MTDKLRSYPVAHREVMPEAVHVTDQYANNRAGRNATEKKIVAQLVSSTFTPCDRSLGENMRLGQQGELW